MQHCNFGSGCQRPWVVDARQCIKVQTPCTEAFLQTGLSPPQDHKASMDLLSPLICPIPAAFLSSSDTLLLFQCFTVLSSSPSKTQHILPSVHTTCSKKSHCSSLYWACVASLSIAGADFYSEYISSHLIPSTIMMAHSINSYLYFSNP